MRFTFFFASAVALCQIAPSPIAAQPTPSAETSSALRQTAKRGALLYAYDRAAWVGTDDVKARFPNLMGEAGGFVATGGLSGVELAFVDKTQTKALYRAVYLRGKLSEAGPPPPERVAVTASERRLLAAKAAGIAAFSKAAIQTCGNSRPNVATLPLGGMNDPIVVYAMTPQTSATAFPVGGHYSVQVGADGRTGSVRRFTNNCVTLSTTAVPNGAKPLALTVVHLLDLVPTEIHVFTSLASRMPIIVGTRDANVWSVRGTQIRLIPPRK